MFGNFLNLNNKENKNNNKDELQKSGKRFGRVDEQGKHVENLEHIRGNAAIGEQVHSVRTYKTDKPMTSEEMRIHWDEMNREAKEWLDNNPGQSANFITSQGIDGNEITRVIPTKDLIFSGSDLVAVFDKDGNQIVGKENIIREIQQRRAERDKWVREGKLENIFDEIHHTDDGWTSNVRFTAYPNQLHPNEVRAENERLLRIAKERSENDKRKNRFLGDGVDSDTEETSKSLIDASNKKSRIGEKKIPTLVGMDIDQPNTSTSQNPKTNQENSDSRVNFELLSDDEIEKADKDQLIDLIGRIKKELEIRKQVEADSSSSFQTSNHRVSTQRLENNLQKAESALNSFQTSIPNTDKKNDNAGIVVRTIAVVSALAIGSIAFVKSKFSKNKRK